MLTDLQLRMLADQLTLTTDDGETFDVPCYLGHDTETGHLVVVVHGLDSEPGEDMGDMFALIRELARRVRSVERVP